MQFLTIVACHRNKRIRYKAFLLHSQFLWGKKDVVLNITGDTKYVVFHLKYLLWPHYFSHLKIQLKKHFNSRDNEKPQK